MSLHRLFGGIHFVDLGFAQVSFCVPRARRPYVRRAARGFAQGVALGLILAAIAGMAYTAQAVLS